MWYVSHMSHVYMHTMSFTGILGFKFHFPTSLLIFRGSGFIDIIHFSSFKPSRSSIFKSKSICMFRSYFDGSNLDSSTTPRRTRRRAVRAKVAAKEGAAKEGAEDEREKGRVVPSQRSKR